MERIPDSGRLRPWKAFPLEPKTLGDVIQIRRRERGLKQRELAVLLAVTNTRIPAWERVEAVPTAEEWTKLAEVLGLPATLEEAQPNS